MLKSLSTTVATPEMSGAELAVEDVLDIRRFDRVFLRFRVKIGFRRREQHVDAGGMQLGAIVLEGARILVEVLVRAELQAIDEDAGDHRVAMGSGLRHQADVAPCRLPMVGNEYDAAAWILQRKGADRRWRE